MGPGVISNFVVVAKTQVPAVQFCSSSGARARVKGPTPDSPMGPGPTPDDQCGLNSAVAQPPAQVIQRNPSMVLPSTSAPSTVGNTPVRATAGIPNSLSSTRVALIAPTPEQAAMPTRGLSEDAIRRLVEYRVHTATALLTAEIPTRSPTPPATPIHTPTTVPEAAAQPSPIPLTEVDPVLWTTS